MPIEWPGSSSYKLGVNTDDIILSSQPDSIEDHIRCLARLTGAPPTFIDQVRSLFISKGIALDSSADPFVKALDEAFRREEHIRASSHNAQNQMAKIRDNFRRVGKAYVEQLSQLRRLQGSVQEYSQQVRKKLSKRRRAESTRVTIKGDHRSFVTRPVRENPPMVPGPKEPQ